MPWRRWWGGGGGGGGGAGGVRVTRFLSPCLDDK